ncbi:hypothetical protein C5748_18325 [Phyllobacterium phragmitis]|uniref:Uncharacterized protein n=1 Tax=Phyllobacterium phragmitis TaxID=2670329 RepID=A0A2S9INL3_9HYPH|nr:hypothetical protein [Phyllobacterium phragmitis]PRD42108.1 hypothetical protein C5748_18325 [Phyllobacterium phragmitis]
MSIALAILGVCLMVSGAVIATIAFVESPKDVTPREDLKGIAYMLGGIVIATVGALVFVYAHQSA